MRRTIEKASLELTEEEIPGELLAAEGSSIVVLRSRRNEMDRFEGLHLSLLLLFPFSPTHCHPQSNYNPVKYLFAGKLLNLPNQNGKYLLSSNSAHFGEEH
jgi:hypothetical protein